MQTITLSESAVFTLRNQIKGYRMPITDRRLAAYRELVTAGIMEPVPGSESEYRFTEDGMEHREEILEREQDRIERERFAPPDASKLSEAARCLLGRISSGERVEITPSNRSDFRELATARIVILGHSFTGGGESVYRFTYWGWHRRYEILGCAKEAG